MADDQVVTNIVARADFSDLIANVRKVTTSLAAMQQQIGSSNKVLSAQINAVNRSFGETLRSTGQFSSHFVSLANDVDVFGKRLDGGKLKLRDYFSTLQTHTRTSGGLIRDLARQQVQLQNAILQPLGRNAQGLMQFNVHVPQGLDEIKNKGAIARQEMQILNKVMQEGAGQLINWGKNTQWAGRQLTVGLTVPIAAFGAAAAKAFREADQELTRLTKVYGGLAATSSAELQKVRRDVTAVANELARGYGASFKETLALSADIAATGKEGAELLGSIRETTRLAVLGEVDRQDAMKATLAIQSAFKQDTDELAKSINFLNAVENQTSTTLNDLVEAIPKAGPVIKGLGGDVQDLALYLTAMREGGINASEGANALKSALASLINPTDVAVKKFQGFGIDLMGIVNNNAGDVTKTLFALQAALNNLSPLQKSQAIEQLFGKFQFARLSALFENLGKQGSQTLKVMDLMKSSSKDLENIATRELSMVTESASGKYKRAVEGLKADLAGIGEEFLKVSTFFVNLVDGIVKFVNKLPAPVKTILTFLAGLTAVTGPLIMLTGVLANFLGYVIKGAFHLKALFKGGEGWRMLTPEILAAEKAGSLIEKTFYSDAKAALALAEALQVLSAGMTSIQAKMNQGVVSVQPLLSTVAGSVIKPPNDDGGGGGGGGGIPRIVDPRNPLVGPAGTRASAHMVPRSGMSAEERAAQTIHSFLPAPIPVNQAVGANPQIYASGDLPAVPGLTTITGKSGPVSTGVVSSEAAKWHTMVGTLSMMTKTEVAQMRTQLSTTGTVSSEFTQAFGSLLPQMTSIAENAAQQSAIIVAEAKAGTISVQTARQRIIALNLQVEQLMAQATMGTAASLGRTAVITAVPTLDQPVVDPKTGKSNMRELFKKGKTRSFVDDLARLMGVRTWGAGYSTHTTRPIRMNMGGRVYNPEVHGNVVPGDTSINYDNTPAVLREGGFILNQSSSRVNPDLVKLAKNSKNAGGKIVPAILTPGETYFPPEIAQEIMPTLEKANSGSVVKLLNAGGILGGRVSSKKLNYGIRITPKGRSLVDVRTIGQLWRQVFTKKAELEPKGPVGFFGGDVAKKTGERLSTTKLNKLLEGDGVTPNVLLASIMSRTSRSRLSTDVFLRGLRDAGIITAAEERRLSRQIFTKYASTIKGMPLVNDKNNPIYSVSDSVIRQELINIKRRDELERFWTQFSRQPGSFADPDRRSSSNFLTSLSVGDKSATFGRLEGVGKGEKFFHAKSTDNPMYAQIAAMHSAQSLNDGGKIGGRVLRGRRNYGIPALSAAVIARLTSKWKKPNPYSPATQKHDWTNTDPLHGPLFIGRADIGSEGVRRSLSYNIPSGRVVDGREGKQLVGISPMMSNDPRYLIERYMAGDKAVLARMQYEGRKGLNRHPLSIQSLFRLLSRPFRGTLYRGMTSQSVSDTLPKHIVEAIEKARATGDFSSLIGRDFIMRRASFTSDPKIATFFAPGSSGSLILQAQLFGRKVTPTSEILPDKKFQAPYGQDWSGGVSSRRYRSEKESLVGGRFIITGFDGKKLIVEGRAMGGPVSGATPYIVGERGPELFVPKNSGGIIPSYALGGIVKGGKINYGELPPGWAQALAQPTLATQMRASGELPPLQASQPSQISKGAKFGLGTANVLGNILGFMGGSALGSKLSGGNQIVSMISGIVASQAIASGLTKLISGITGIGTAASGSAAKTSLLTKAFKMFIGLPGPLKLLAVVVGVGAAIKGLNDKIEEHRRIVSSGFGITEESAKKLGLQYKKLGSEIDAYQEKYDLMLAKAAANRYNQTKAEGKGIDITVPELEKLKKQVAKDFPDEIKMFDKATNKEAIERATNLKAAMVATGKSVEEANEIILAMIMNSNKSAIALDILGDRGFGKIQGKISATNSTVKTFANVIKEGNFDQLPIALQTAVNALDNLQQSFIKTDTNTKKAVTSSQAYEKVINQISKGANKAIGEKGLEEIIAQNEELRDIIDSTDTLASIWAKIKLSTSGITFDLKNMSVETANTLALLLEQQKDYLRSNDSLIGSAADLIAKTGNITSNQLIKNANRTKESIQKEIELRQKNIKRIKEEADAKKKALDEETEAEDFLLQIQKKQIEYSEALASGDMAGAAQAQLDIQSMTGARQLDLAKTAIDDKANKDIQKQEKIIDGLTKALDGLSKTLEKQIAAASSEQAKKSDMQELYDLFFQAVGLGMGGVTSDEKLIIGDIAKQLRNSGIKEFVDLADKYLKMSPTGNYVGSMQPMGYGALESLASSSYSVIAGKIQVEDTETLKAIQALKTGKPVESTATFTPKATTEKSAMGTKTVYTITPDQYVNSGMYVEGENPVAKKKTFLDYLGRRFQVVGIQEDGDYIVERKFAMGGIIKNFMPGGNVTGPGTGTSDSIPAMLSNGEYVIKADSVKKYGKDTFDALNAQRFADGGPVNASSLITPSVPYYMNYGGMVPGYKDGGLMDKIRGGMDKIRGGYRFFKDSMYSGQNQGSAMIMGMLEQAGYLGQTALSSVSKGIIPKPTKQQDKDFQEFTGVPGVYRALTNKSAEGPMGQENLRAQKLLDWFTVAGFALPVAGRASIAGGTAMKPGLSKIATGMKSEGLPYFRRETWQGSQFRQDVEATPILKQIAETVLTPLDRGRRAVMNFKNWDDTVPFSRKAASALDGIFGLQDTLSTTARPSVIKDSLLSMYRTGHAFDPDSKWGFIEPGSGLSLMKSRAGSRGKTIRQAYIDEASIGAERFIEQYMRLIHFLNPKTWPGIKSSAQNTMMSWSPKKIADAISYMYRTGHAYDINDMSRNVFTGKDFKQRVIDKANPGAERFVEKNLQSLYLLNIKNIMSSARTKLGSIKDKMTAPGLIPYMMPGAGEMTTPSFIKHIDHPGLRAIFETFYMRHRVVPTPENLAGELPKVPVHPSETKVVTGRTRGPGMYFAATPRLSKEFYDFGPKVYRPKLNLTMLKAIFKSKGYIKGTPQLNALIEEYNATAPAQAIQPETGFASTVQGGLSGAIGFDHPLIRFLMDKGYIGYTHGMDENALTAATNWLIGLSPKLGYKRVMRASGGIVTDADKYAGGMQMNIPKFEKGINMVPADMLAMLHKNEAVVPANMNPFNPNAQSYSQPSISYNIAPVINAAPGMDEQAIANMATRQVLAEIKAIDSRNMASMGRPGMRVVGK